MFSFLSLIVLSRRTTRKETADLSHDNNNLNVTAHITIYLIYRLVSSNATVAHFTNNL